MNDQDNVMRSRGQENPRFPRLLVEDPRLFFHDSKLSVGARMLMAYLVSSPTDADGAVDAHPLTLSIAFTVQPAEADTWAQELEQEGYVQVVARDNGLGYPTRVRIRPDVGRPPLAVGRDGFGEFHRTMESLFIPENLRRDYADIYTGLQDRIPEFVRMRNVDTLQRLIDKVSASLDGGTIDGRGPVGLLIYMVQKAAKVPPRDFGAESRQTEARASRSVQASPVRTGITEQMDWGPPGIQFDPDIPSIPSVTGPDHGPTGAACVTLDN